MGMKNVRLRNPLARRSGTPTRSRASLGLLALPLAAVLIGATGCSSDDSGDSAKDASSTASASAGAFPVSVDTKFGSITVKEQPKRVVALGWGDAETALALGVQPVGESDWLAFGGDGVGPWAKGLYTKSPEKIGTMEPEYEKIAALKPDLILDTKSSGDQTRYDTLSKIAPVIGVPKGGDQYKLSWEQQTKMVSTALGKKAEGDKLIKGVEDKFAAAAKAHPEFKDKTVTLASKTSVGWGAYVSGTGRVDFIDRLGFKNNPVIEKQAGDAFSVSVSEENLDQFDADLIVTAPIGLKPAQVTSDALYKKIPAVADGHAMVFDQGGLSQAFATDSILSTSYAIDHVVPEFAKYVKK
ncbi:iron-siderophore ABC transporter substrate-binding protein [Streptomyces sp. NBC_01335]|uniref:iron-siderophore ABC transporter substrate-binding protein n=1 Tax=Streptomyces sp. NBC_01335 TaxID=2903828 RepID=UPI002E0E9FC5|nr:iron-siderophore ABC transporter substrate-binding protein [Streptomyces sp. NBC_01335]